MTPDEAFAAIGKGTDIYFSRRHDAALGDGASEWPLRLAGRACREACERIGGAPLSPRLRGRRDRHRFPVEQCDRRSADAGGRRRGESGASGEALPYLLVCALVANAASFVLPISNPANLVVYGAAMPPLALWLRLYLPASAVAIVATYCLLRWDPAPGA